jgi:hypothetical protein
LNLEKGINRKEKRKDKRKKILNWADRHPSRPICFSPLLAAHLSTAPTVWAQGLVPPPPPHARTSDRSLTGLARLPFAQPRTRLYCFSLPCGPRSEGESSSWTPHPPELNELRACRRRFSGAVDLNPPFLLICPIKAPITHHPYCADQRAINTRVKSGRSRERVRKILKGKYGQTISYMILVVELPNTTNWTN